MSRGNWIQTYTGKRFYPLDPQPEDVNPWDIAHALSMLCRFGGHSFNFYSVSEHCVLMSNAVSFQNSVDALLHDAAEAYVVDIPRPLKQELKDYKIIETNVLLAIYQRFGLELKFPAEVKEADNRILLTERAALMPNTTEPWGDLEALEPLPVDINGYTPKFAERLYLERMESLELLS